MPYLCDELLGLLLGDAELDQLAQVLGFGLFDAELGVDRVEVDQGIARLDPVANVVMDLDDAAGPLATRRSLASQPRRRADDVNRPLDRSPFQRP